MNSGLSRGIVVIVLLTCSILLLWWFVPRGEDRGGYVVTDVTSGDTIVVTRDGVTHTVLIEGIVTPNHGECGFKESRANLVEGIKGADVALIPDSRAEKSTDNPGQVLRRYVDFKGRDVGLAQIEEGFATAQDGEFDRGGEYRAAAAKATPFTCN